jgi:hypothetical protein
MSSIASQAMSFASPAIHAAFPPENSKAILCLAAKNSKL